jgi:hypothetical protein
VMVEALNQLAARRRRYRVSFRATADGAQRDTGSP